MWSHSAVSKGVTPKYMKQKDGLAAVWLGGGTEQLIGIFQGSKDGGGGTEVTFLWFLR